MNYNDSISPTLKPKQGKEKFPVLVLAESPKGNYTNCNKYFFKNPILETRETDKKLAEAEKDLTLKKNCICCDLPFYTENNY